MWYLKVLLQDPALFTLIKEFIVIENFPMVSSARAAMKLGFWKKNKSFMIQPIAAL